MLRSVSVSASVLSRGARKCGHRAVQGAPISRIPSCMQPTRLLSTVPFESGGDFASSSSPTFLESVGSSSSTDNLSDDGRTFHSHQKFQCQVQQWIEVNPQTAPYKAEEALAKAWAEQKERHDHAPNVSLFVTTESVNTVLKAWDQSHLGMVAAKRAERLLRWMEDLQSDGHAAHLPKPDYQSYATVISSWANAAIYESNQTSAVEVVTNSRGRVKQMVSQSIKIGFECAKRSEDAMMHMQETHSLLQEDGCNSELQPDTTVFHHVLKGWSEIKGGTKASATRAMRILDLMQELHHYQTQSSTVDSWQGMPFSKAQPNLKTYKYVIQAWARASHAPEGPDRAEEVLRHLLSMSQAGGNETKPDVECFHMVMNAHKELVRKKRAKSDDGVPSVERARKVTALLEWLELLSTRNPKLQPTVESYRIAMQAWVWSNHVDAPDEAEFILSRMIRSGNVETRDYNTLINSCAFARGVGVDMSEEGDESVLQRQLAHQELFDCAERTLQALLSSTTAHANSASFAGIMRACVNLLPNTDERDACVIELFRLAYRTPLSEDFKATRMVSTASERKQAPAGGGCVDANVLGQLRKALPSTEDYIRIREDFETYRLEKIAEEQRGL